MRALCGCGLCANLDAQTRYSLDRARLRLYKEAPPRGPNWIHTRGRMRSRAQYIRHYLTARGRRYRSSKSHRSNPPPHPRPVVFSPNDVIIIRSIPHCHHVDRTQKRRLRRPHSLCRAERAHITSSLLRCVVVTLTCCPWHRRSRTCAERKQKARHVSKGAGRDDDRTVNFVTRRTLLGLRTHRAADYASHRTIAAVQNRKSRRAEYAAENVAILNTNILLQTK